MMDLSKITTGQLSGMHIAAARDCAAAIERAAAAGEIMDDLTTAHVTAYEAAAANFRILLARAAELREQSRVLYDEICRRAGIDGERAVYDAMHGTTSPNGTRYCRTCGFSDCPGKDTGNCPRWPARGESFHPATDAMHPVRDAMSEDRDA